VLTALDDWQSVAKIINEASFYLNYVGFGGHMDMDMDMFIIGHTGALFYEEERTHMAIWSIMKSPLLIGTNLDCVSEDSLAILKAKTLIEFNQDDVHGDPAKPFKRGSSPPWTFDKRHPPEYYSGRFKGGILLALFNNREPNEGRYMDFVWDEVPEVELGKSYRIVDGWKEDVDYGCFLAEAGQPFFVGPVERHDTAVVILQDDFFCEVRNKFSPKKRTIQADYLIIEDTRRQITIRGKAGS
jgi:alpha-galactosidase